MNDRGVKSAAEVNLLDGRPVSLRRLGPDDAEAVLTLHQKLSDHDRYFRFFTVHPVHLEELAQTLTEPGSRPGNQHCAVGAFDADHLIGVVSYVVCDDPSSAEMAIVVAHDYHLLGVGTALLRHLALIARTNGIRRFIADVMAQNHPMLKVVSDIGWSFRQLTDGSFLRLEIELPECLDDAPPAANEASTPRSSK